MQDPCVQFSLYRIGAMLYFLNQTTQVLDKVTSHSVNIVRTDDEGTTATTSKFTAAYEFVQPDEAILIEEFDEYFDADCVIYTVIDVHSNATTESFCVGAKGGSGTKVLKRSS